MNVTLPKPDPQYTYDNEVETRRLVEQAFNDVLSRNENITLQPAQLVILTSPGGTKYAITVADDGTLGTAAV